MIFKILFPASNFDDLSVIYLFSVVISCFVFMLQIIIKIAAANGVKRVWVGQDTLLSTPAVSAIIRDRVNSYVSSNVTFLMLRKSAVNNFGVA